MNFNENAIEMSDIDLTEPLDATEFQQILQHINEENMDWEDIETSNLIDEQTYSTLLADLHHDDSFQTPQTGGALVEDDVYDAEEGYEPPQNQLYAEDYYSIERVRDMHNRFFNHSVADGSEI